MTDVEIINNPLNLYMGMSLVGKGNKLRQIGRREGELPILEVYLVFPFQA